MFSWKTFKKFIHVLVTLKTVSLKSRLILLGYSVLKLPQSSYLLFFFFCISSNCSRSERYNRHLKLSPKSPLSTRDSQYPSSKNTKMHLRIDLGKMLRYNQGLLSFMIAWTQYKQLWIWFICLDCKNQEVYTVLQAREKKWSDFQGIQLKTSRPLAHTNDSNTANSRTFFSHATRLQTTKLWTLSSNTNISSRLGSLCAIWMLMLSSKIWGWPQNVKYKYYFSIIE